MTINRRSISVLFITTAASAFIATAGSADTRDASNYVGVKMCAICHKKDDSGNQMGVWEKGPHAKAFETLGTDKAKEIAKKQGIDDPQKRPTSNTRLFCTKSNFTKRESASSKTRFWRR